MRTKLSCAGIIVAGAVALGFLAPMTPHAATLGPSVLAVPAFRARDTIRWTLSRDSSGPDGSRSLRGVVDAIVRSASDDTVDVVATVKGENFPTFSDTVTLDLRTLRLHDPSGADTSANTSSFLNAALYGLPTEPLAVGKTWRTTVDSWINGPPGTSTVRVASIDRARRALRLEITGSGNGTIGNDAKYPQNLVVTINGKSAYKVTRTEGRSDWHGYVELAGGVVRHTVLVVKTQLTTPATPESPLRHDVETVTLESKLLELHRAL